MERSSGHSQPPPVPSGPPTAAVAQFPPQSSVAAAASANPIASASARRSVFVAPRPSAAAKPAAAPPGKPKSRAKASAAKKRPAMSSASVPTATGPPRSKKKAVGCVSPQVAGGDSRLPPAPPPPPPAVEEVEFVFAPPTARNVVEEMPQSLDDDAFLHSMDIGDTPSQEYANNGYEDEAEEDEDVLGDEGLDQEDEGFLDDAPKGRSANYNRVEDKLICTAWKKIGLDAAVGTEQPGNAYWNRMTDYFNENTNSCHRSMDSIRHRWKTISTDCQKWSACLAHVNRLNPSGTNDDDRATIAQGFFKGKMKKGKKGKKPKEGKSFTLHHCWTELENDEKWRNRDMYDVPRKSTKSSVGDATIIDDDEASSEEGRRSPTPNSVAKTKRPDGRKYAKEKAKRGGDVDIKTSLDAMINVRKEMAEERKMMRKQELEELRAAEERRAAAEERRAAAEERKAAAEELKAQVEDKKVAIEEARRAEEREDKLMFMETSGMSETQRKYVELCRDQMLAKKQMMGYMGGFGGGMGGASMAGMGGGMAGMGAYMGSIGGGMPAMGTYMSGVFGGSMGGDMGASMGGGIPSMAGGMSGGISSNTTHVGDDVNGEETPNVDDSNGGNGDN